MTAPPRRAPQATVIGDSDPPPEVARAAEAVGALLARLGVTVITGGRGGVMEAACRGAVQAGGRTVGIVPSADMREGNPWCTIVIPTGLGYARNAVTALAGDFVIAIGGGAGTLSEIAFAWLYGRPILVLAGTGGWSDRLDPTGLDPRGLSTITRCPDLAALEAAVRERCGRAESKGRPGGSG